MLVGVAHGGKIAYPRGVISPLPFAAAQAALNEKSASAKVAQDADAVSYTKKSLVDDALLSENKLLFTLDLIKEKLSTAYTMTDEAKMAEAVIDIMDICKATGNKHLLWFYNLLDSHFEGIIAHATYKISAGKIEGINQKIKTLRRHGYGYPDDEYFFLKVMDISRKEYVRNQPSHKICD